MVQDRSLRILQVGRDVEGTGGGKVLIETARRMARQGHHVRILTDVELPSVNAQSIEVETTRFGNYLKDLNPKTRLGRILRHTAQLLIFSWLGSIRARSLAKNGWIVINHNIEVFAGDILVIHNVFSAEHEKDPRSTIKKSLRWLNPIFTFRIIRERIMLASAHNKIVCAVSKIAADEARTFIPSSTMLTSIGNGVDTEAFHPLTDTDRSLKRRKLGLTGKFVILFVGHEFERKGLATLIESLTLLPNNVILKVVGGRGSTQENYEKLATKLGVMERITFHGTKNNTKEYYQVADVFALPSAYETWALVGLESMACGTPTLITKTGGISEYLEDGINGFFIERDAKDISKKITTLLADEELRATMKKNARNTAINHSWDKSSESYLDLTSRAFSMRP